MANSPPSRPSLGLRLNIGLLRFSRNWLRVFLVVLGLYAALPWAAPTLMHFGFDAPARALYFLYGPFCHQFAFRSFFLFGDQYAYPRSIARTDLTPYEAYIDDSPEFDQALAAWVGRPTGMFPTVEAFIPSIWSFELQFASRDFFGTEQMGYKTALCQRDVSLYAAMFAFSVIYSIPVIRRRLRPLPLLLYLFAGVLPIALDGFSQLFGYVPSGSVIQFWQPRETTPFFRVLTGAIFGAMTGWLALPYLEDSFRQTREQLEEKLAQAGIRIP